VKISRQQLRKIIQEAFWSNKDIGSVEDVETVGDLRKLIASAQDAKRWEQTKGEAGEAVKGAIVDEILGKIPGASAAKSLFDFVKASYDLPDDARTGTALDHLDVDDDVAKIVDDPIENSFLDALGKRLESMDGEKRLADLDMTSLLSDYIRAEFNSRTVSGFKEGKTMKITKRQLRKIIAEEKAKMHTLREVVVATTRQLKSVVSEASELVAGEFLEMVFQLADEDPELYAAGRLTRDEWAQQVNNAAADLRVRLREAINKTMDDVELSLQAGEYER
jgi:hypothetical protein